MATRVRVPPIDDFNRAGPALGANYTQHNTALGGSVTIIGTNDAVAGGVSGAQAVARWVGAGTFLDDQYASIKISDPATGSSPSYGMGVGVRISADADATRDYYYALVSNNVTILGKVVNGVDTVLASNSTPTWAAGDRVELECEGQILRVCQNGVPLGGAFTLSDNSLVTGLPGIVARGDPGIVSGDDLDIGNMFTPPTNIVPRRSMKLWNYR